MQEKQHSLSDATLRAKSGAGSIVRIDKVHHLLRSSNCRRMEKAEIHFKVSFDRAKICRAAAKMSPVGAP